MEEGEGWERGKEGGWREGGWREGGRKEETDKREMSDMWHSIPLLIFLHTSIFQ